MSEPDIPARGRRRFLKTAGALVAAAPVAAVLQAAASAEAEAAPAAPRKPRPKSRIVPAPAAPAVAGVPDFSVARNAGERAVLERQWKGLLDLVKVIRDAPLDPATEPATAFAALPRTPARTAARRG